MTRCATAVGAGVDAMHLQRHFVESSTDVTEVQP